MERIKKFAKTPIIAFVICVITVSCNEAAGDGDIPEPMLQQTDGGESTEDASDDSIPEPILLSGIDSGESILVIVGQEIQITLQTIGPGRYGVPEITSSTVKFIGEGDAGLQDPGGPRQIFRFYGVEAGEAEIRIPHENGIGEMEPFALIIKIYDGEIPKDAGAPSYDGPIIEIDPTHQACEIDSDCVTAMTHCSCHCGVAVHKDYWQIYIDKQSEACSNYNGMMCDMLCEEVPGCIEHECVLVEPE